MPLLIKIFLYSYKYKYIYIYFSFPLVKKKQQNQSKTIFDASLLFMQRTYGGHGEADSQSDRAAAESSEQSART